MVHFKHDLTIYLHMSKPEVSVIFMEARFHHVIKTVIAILIQTFFFLLRIRDINSKKMLQLPILFPGGNKLPYIFQDRSNAKSNLYKLKECIFVFHRNGFYF